MSTNTCRVCGHPFFAPPLLRYDNMPKAAQFLPDAESLENESGVHLEVCQCSGCGLVQLSNDPVPYFRQVVRAVAFSEEMKNFRLHQFDGFIRQFGLKGKRVIEIGCGRGEYLALLAHLGVDAFGIEDSEESVMRCVETGLKVSKGFVDSSSKPLNHAPFDAFVLLSFLEHLPDPNSTLGGIHHNLTDVGVGLVEVPNFDMILRKNLFSEFIGDHLSYFTRETLTTILQLNGFEVIDCREIWSDYILSTIVKKRQQLDLNRFRLHQRRLTREIEAYLLGFGAKKAAVWGAGHQALAVLSLLNLTDRIRYVVDSATFKQNKFTPATHLPIVAPDTLVSDPVDAVIIMAGSYSDEVATLIRKQYDQILSISILRDYGLEIV